MAEATDGADADTAPPAPKASAFNTGGAGTAEATLLMIGALGDAGRAVAARAAAALPTDCGAVVVIGGDAMPDFAPLDQFDLACAQLTAQLDAALADPAPAPAAAERDIGDRDIVTAVTGAISGAINPVNAATELIKAVAAAAQFFAVQTTYTALALEPNDAVLLREVAGALVARTPLRRVLTAPQRNEASRAALFKTVQDLGDRAARAAATANVLGDQSGTADRVAALRAAAAAGTDFCSQLIKTDGAAPSGLAAIIGLHALRAHLANGGAILTTHVAAAGGGLLARSGLFLGILRDPPNRVFGMAVAAFTLAAGPELEVLAAGNVRASSQYVPMRDIGTWGTDAAAVKNPD